MVTQKTKTTKSTKTSKTTKSTKTAKATKSTTAKKVVAKPAATKAVSEISVNGNKKIETLAKEFNKKFPYLRLGIFYSYAREQVKKGERITSIPGDKTLAQVRRADSGGNISISGNKRVGSLEKEFDTVFGLYCQVCYTAKDGHRYYTSGTADTLTLSALNKKIEAEGGKKGEWK